MEWSHQTVFAELVRTGQKTLDTYENDANAVLESVVLELESDALAALVKKAGFNGSYQTVIGMLKELATARRSHRPTDSEDLS